MVSPSPLPTNHDIAAEDDTIRRPPPRIEQHRRIIHSSQPYPHPLVSFFSWATFSWVSRTLHIARYGVLRSEDLPELPEYLQSKSIALGIAHKYRQADRFPLIRALIRELSSRYIRFLFTLRFAIVVCTLIRPLILYYLLKYINTRVTSNVVEWNALWSRSWYEWSDVLLSHAEGLILIAMLSAASALLAILSHHQWWYGVHFALAARTSAIGLVFDRLMKAAASSTRTHSIGNLATVDADNVMAVCWGAIYEVWSAPILISVTVIALYILLGPSALVGVAVLLLSLFVSSVLAGMMSRMQSDLMELSDVRIKRTAELLAAFKLIRLYAWTKHITTPITAVREEQVALLLRISIISALNRVTSLAAPLLTSLSTFLTYTLLGNVLTADTAFTALCLFGLLKEPMGKLPEAVNTIVKFLISAKRIESFMECALRDEYVHHKDGDVRIMNGTFEWIRDGQSAPQTQSPQSLTSPYANSTVVSSPKPANVNVNLSSAHDLTGSANGSTVGVDIGGVICLRDINIHIRRGEFVLLVGAVGSSKSALVLAILGELKRIGGDVFRPEHVAYTAQTPFLLSASIRSNITFGLDFDADYYQRTLGACALLPDLERLPNGDMTIVGERGIMLSGGQQHRLALARAVYARADLYVLDEPLGAVDAHVAKWLFDKAIGPRGVLNGATRIVATHQTQFAPFADRIIVMENGRIKVSGTYAEIVASGLQLSAITLADGHQLTRKVSVNQTSERLTYVDDESGDGTNEDATMSADADELLSMPMSPSANDALIGVSEPVSSDLSAEDYIEVGSVDSATYKHYLDACAPLYQWIFVLIIIVSSQAASVGSEWYLSVWSAVGDASGATVYAALIAISTALLLLRSAVMSLLTTRASKSLHTSMLESITRVPQSFIDTTPSGRIQTRFSKDTDLIDTQLPNVVQDVVSCGAAVGGTVALIVVVLPVSIVPLIAVCFLYATVQRYYRPASVTLKRLESVTRSPIYGWFNETVNGLLTIRAFCHQGAVDRTYDEAMWRLDVNTRMWTYAFSVHRWMGIRLELIGALVIFITSFLSVALSDWLGVARVGLLVTTSMTLNASLHWFVRQTTELEVQMNACERINEYATLQGEESTSRVIAGEEARLQTALPLVTNGHAMRPDKKQKTRTRTDGKYMTVNDEDASDIDESDQPPSPVKSVTNGHSHHSVSDMIVPSQEWPETGRIDLIDLSIAYRKQTPNVLHGITATFRGGEKIGIVGRTASGKSSLSLAIFRLMEATNGRILIDGIDIASVPLYILRSRLSIVPQDSLLFNGTLRFNLDPNERYDDETILNILKRVNMYEFVETLPSGLLSAVTNDDLSVGQRQLLCLARAALRQSRIVIFDEATAAVDLSTDEIIKQFVNEVFSNSTVIIIAHRLNTVMHCDRVLVLDNGKILEFDTVQQLTSNSNSALSALLKDAHALTQTNATPILKSSTET